MWLFLFQTTAALKICNVEQAERNSALHAFLQISVGNFIHRCVEKTCAVKHFSSFWSRNVNCRHKRLSPNPDAVYLEEKSVAASTPVLSASPATRIDHRQWLFRGVSIFPDTPDNEWQKLRTAFSFLNRSIEIMFCHLKASNLAAAGLSFFYVTTVPSCTNMDWHKKKRVKKTRTRTLMFAATFHHKAPTWKANKHSFNVQEVACPFLPNETTCACCWIRSCTINVWTWISQRKKQRLLNAVTPADSLFAVHSTYSVRLIRAAHLDEQAIYQSASKTKGVSADNILFGVCFGAKCLFSAMFCDSAASIVNQQQPSDKLSERDENVSECSLFQSENHQASVVNSSFVTW